ncbi:ArsR/SmtB family transcription factor [Haloplanus sp.]|uniref:ArsR/SmtB family transcription factor n=1 Tax=Haloplanus sp. TaxID=1961696 RepID=UPI002622144B|nr:transcriptional regulator [Haloplanus sp.]
MCPESRPDATDILTLLGDEYVQAILVATSTTPKSAKELSDELGTARSTIYEKTEQLVAHDLLVERTRIMNDGSHHSVYEANVKHLDVDLNAGDFQVRVQTRDTPASRFTNIWNDIREA